MKIRMDTSKKIIVTTRLFLREFKEEDILCFEKMNSDPDVVRYTSDFENPPEIATKRFLQVIEEYKEYGMGRWTLINKDTNEVLGWYGLKYHPEEKIVDIGYRLYKKHWRKGYATEATKACLDYGFNTLNLKEIYAHIHSDNKASGHVLKKCGLNFEKEIVYKNKPVYLYKIKKND